MFDTVVVKNKISKARGPAFRLGLETVHIYVENQESPFQVHLNIIIRSSEFFRNAFMGGFNENRGVIHLQTLRKELVEIYVEWLYLRKINPIDDDADVGPHRFQDLYDMYVMADMIQDVEFANAVMDTLLKECDKTEIWPTSLATSAWNELPETSPMRKLIKDIWVARSCSAWFSQGHADMSTAPAQFWMEVAELHILVKEKKEKALKPSWANRCRYHYHKDGVSCS